MQAIILAAGMGKRLKELTQDRTKCMVQVNGVALIDRMLHQIESRHLSRMLRIATKPAFPGLEEAPTTAMPSGWNNCFMLVLTSKFRIPAWGQERPH